jgi:hypothetical protein
VKKLICFLLLLTFSKLKAQEFIIENYDTINYNFRSGTSKNDSLDLIFTSLISLNPGGNRFHPFGWNQISYFNFTKQFSESFIEFRKHKILFTALPHLGFVYSFGSKGIQFMHTDFQQLINKNTLLNFNFEMQSIGDMMRNGAFRNSNIDFKILHQSKQWKNHFVLSYQQARIQYNDGLADTSLVNSFPYDFLAVNKSNAFSLQKNVLISNQLAKNFSKDSLRFFGPTLKTEWSIKNRVYEERDDLNAIYSKINIDSFSTRDQFQVAKLSNAIGLYFKNHHLTGEVLIQHKYWDFQNLARHNDTNEISLLQNISFTRNQFKFANNFSFTFLGAIGEIENQLKAKYHLKQSEISFNYLFERKLPAISQRHYFANNHSFQTYQLDLQTRHEVNLLMNLNSKSKYSFGINFLQLNNNYFYIDNVWRNDTLSNLTFLSLKLKADYHFSVFGIQPYASFNISPQNFSYIPQYDFRLRLFFNKKFFKAKKLDFIMGVDLASISSHQLLRVDPTLGIYTLNNFTNFGFSNPYYGLDFFMGMQINVFRFYVRVEKIDYLFSDRNQWVISKTPVAPMFFRVGLTWDFYN